MTPVNFRMFPGTDALPAGPATVATGAVGGLVARAVRATPKGRGKARPTKQDDGYGPLLDMGELWLPRGFRYVAFGRAGTPLALTRWGAPAGALPGGHGAMASFAAGAGTVRLVRNHDKPAELSPLGGGGYDCARFAGTTTMEFHIADPDDTAKDGDRFRGQWVGLRGMSTSSCGGTTPWRSWLAGEGTVEAVTGVPHGYMFQVASDADGPVEPAPLRAMGRFVHGGVAIDPRTDIAYETEGLHTNPAGLGSGFYRFVPTPAAPYGTEGRLEMLAVKGRPNHDTSTDQRTGQPLAVTWVPIPDPDPVSATADPWAVFRQGAEPGGAVFNRLGAAWYSEGSIFFISDCGIEAGRPATAGLRQIWQYIPRKNGGQLLLVVDSRNQVMAGAPHKITVGPRGGLIGCDARDGLQYLRGITRDGGVFDFAIHPVVNQVEPNEFAGVSWSPDGEWLFVNIQNPGVTYAITGPWTQGPL